ncbi:MAG: M24 family metallopeptidase, partial [Armatimonadetes bacterium]|nr:M24 family metallopeptidase [Armatimonadota bacterium]
MRVKPLRRDTNLTPSRGLQLCCRKNCFSALTNSSPALGMLAGWLRAIPGPGDPESLLALHSARSVPVPFSHRPAMGRKGTPCPRNPPHPRGTRWIGTPAAKPGSEDKSMQVRLRALGILVVLSGIFTPVVQAQAPLRGGLPSDDLFANPARAVHRFDDFVYTASERRAEASRKVIRVRELLALRKLDGLLLATDRNVSWLTAGGKSTVVWAQREAPVKLLVTADQLLLVANNIEAPRLQTEELNGLGYETLQYPWQEAETRTLSPRLKGKKIAFDHPGTAAEYGFDPSSSAFDFTAAYYPIHAGELKKLRWLGSKTAEILEQVARIVRPGMTERDVQYLLCREFWYWDIFPTVVLSAVDERFKTYRHPVVFGETLKNYVALNVCARRWGLVVSTTRLVHFGDPDPALDRAWKSGPRVCAAMWAASRPGQTLGDVIQAAQRAYREIGHPEEWKLHHQGGMIHGLERLYLVPPGDQTKIVPG